MEINYDNLEYDDNLFLLDGKPFTGLAVQHDEQGRKMCEIPLVEGVYHGTARSWYADGALKGEEHNERGLLNGIRKEWFPDGRLKREETWEYGWTMKLIEWNERGDVVKFYELGPTDGMYEEIVRRRKARG
jgi:antitoxin component YwqK of YwqJK toxin-antitoxin module